MVYIWVVPFDTPAIVCHHSSVPPPLISCFHCFNILVEAFTLLVANVATVGRKPFEMLCKKCNLALMLAPRRWYASSMLCTTCTKFAAFLLPRKFCATPTKPRLTSTSNGFMECMKFSSCISFRMSGPSKILALSFSRLSPGNDWQIYLKHSPFLSRAFTDCLISPNFICRRGSIILSLGTSGSFMTFLSPTLSVSRGSQSFLIQWLALSRLSHIHKKHGCFV